MKTTLTPEPPKKASEVFVNCPFCSARRNQHCQCDPDGERKEALCLGYLQEFSTYRAGYNQALKDVQKL